MHTVNPAMLGPEMLAQLRGIPASNEGGNVKSQSEDVKMYTVHRGAIPPNIQAALASPAQAQRSQPQYQSTAPKSYIPTRSAPTPTPAQQNQQVQSQPPAQLQIWEREILASNEVKRKVSWPWKDRVGVLLISGEARWFGRLRWLSFVS